MNTLQELREKYPLCQKRTARHRPFTFWAGEQQVDGTWKADTIIKGPYSPEKLTTLLGRFELLSKLHAGALAYPSKIQDNFIYFPNIAPQYAVSTQIVTSKIDGEFSVIKRNGLVKLGDIISKKGFRPQLQNLQDVLLTLCYLGLMHVGDMGMYNILYDTGNNMMTIIDIDETRTREKNHQDELFYFTGEPSGKKAQIWLAMVRPHYQHILRIIDEQIKDESMRENLRKYLASPYVSRKINNSKNKNVIASKPARVIETRFCTFDRSRMKWGGPFNGTITPSGLDWDVAKSGLQKYIRRNNPQQACYYANELYLLGELPNAKAAMGSLFNRLGIIAMEDIGVANPALAMSTLQMVMRKNPRPPLQEVLAHVQALCASTKIRLISQIRHAIQLVPLNIPKIIPPAYIIDWQKGDPMELRPPTDRMFDELIWCRDNANGYEKFGFLRNLPQIMRLGEDGKLRSAARRRRTHYSTILWEGFLKLCPVLEPLYQFFYSHNFTERSYFLLFAGCLAVLRCEEQPLKIESVPIPAEIRDGNYQLRVDPFVIDMHTREGRDIGSDRHYFVTEASKVIPEDPRFIFPELREIYQNGV